MVTPSWLLTSRSDASSLILGAEPQAVRANRHRAQQKVNTFFMKTAPFDNYKTDSILLYYNRRERIKKVPMYSGKPGKMTEEVHETFLVLSGALC